MEDLIPDLPEGPLDTYRKRANFDWKSLKLNLEGEQLLMQQKKLWELIASSPIFQNPNKRLTIDEERRLCNQRIQTFVKNDLVPFGNTQIFYYIMHYDPAIVIKMGIMYGMVPSALISLGTEYHKDLVPEILASKYTCSFALTEFAHGTNAKGIRTTATYDKKTKQFILHSADFEAAKCWSGGLGKTATHAMIYAQLITPDGMNHGPHPFIVPIRDPNTFLPYNGVTVGDMGDKISLQALDNGFAIFTNYPISRQCLLNKTADVSEDGRYVCPIKDQSRRFGISLGALSAGRVGITTMSANYMTLALIIAIRYCACRKQFGPSKTEEWPVIEYQAQQYRLFPHLATGYVMKLFAASYLDLILDYQLQLMISEDKDGLAKVGMEIHALSSAAKPLCSWLAMDAIQQCRESCGGHGYLKISRLGDIRAQHDANCTYEGENNVLIQQASNWLISQWSNILQGKPISSPLGSIDYLPDAKNILNQKFTHTTVRDVMEPENQLQILKWLVCYYLQRTYQHVEKLKRAGNSDFQTRNNSQTFFARTLSLVYAETALAKHAIERIGKGTWKENERVVLRKLCSLYSAVILERRLGDLYAGGYALPSSRIDELLREGIMLLCKDLLDDAVALVDVLAPPDHIINSPLGMSDGQVYKHLEERILGDKQNLERPSWWKEILSQSKL